MPTELGHTFTHAWDADAETSFAGRRTAVGGKGHAVAKVDDFEGEVGFLLAETDLGGGTAGMALNVGETFLDDAEESDFEGLRETLEIGASDELRVDAAALTEALDVFLESGEKAKIVEQGRMEEIGKGADFTGHLLGKDASSFERDSGGFFLGREGLTHLGETEVDGQDSLG